MSADDFQTKYASVMDGMLKSAVAETTKLFETMVDELKAEILRLKTENDDLRTKCVQFENTKSQAHVCPTESEPLPGASDGFEKRDTAVQCELVPFRTMLVEQCQPLRDSSLQNQEQQWRYEEMEYGLQEHNYVSHRQADSQMAYIQVKQEDDDDSCLQSVLKQEEDEPPVVSGQVVSDKAGSPPTSACGTESKGLEVNQEFSTGDVPLPQKDKETMVALELRSMEIDNRQQGVQNQSSEPEHSLVISLAAIKDDMEEQSEISLKISEMGPQAEIISSDDHQLVVAQHQSDDKHLEKEKSSVVPQHCEREGEVNKQTDVTLQQNGSVRCVVEQLSEPTLHNKEVAHEASQTCMAVGESNSQPVHRKRGRPAKKVKRLQQPVKVLQSSSTTTEQEMVTSSVSVEEVQVSSVVDVVNITASESLKVSPVKSKKPSSIITQSLQDGVNTALEENADTQVGFLPVSEVSLRKGCSSNMEKTSESHFMEMEDAESQSPFNEVSSASKTMNTPQAASFEAKHRRTSATLQDAMLLVEAMNQSTVENALSSPQIMAVVPQTKCAPLKFQTFYRIPAKSALLPVVDHKIAEKLPVTELSTSKLSKEIRNAASKTRDTAPNNEAQAHLTGFIPNQQHEVNFSSTTTLPVSLSSAATQASVGSVQQHTLHPLMSAAPRKLSNTAPPKIIVVPSSSSVLPQKIAALSPTQLPAVVSTVVARSTSCSPAVQTTSLSSVLQKTIYVTSRKLLPVVASQTRTTSRDQQSKVIIIPRQSQTFILTAKQDSVASPSLVTVESPHLTSSQKLNASAAQTTEQTDEVATSLSQNNLESPKQTTTDPETKVPLTETSLNTSVGYVLPYALPDSQPAIKEKLSAMVRLTRLPFPVSTKESVLVSKLISNGSSETRSVLKESTTEKISTQPSETPVLSTDVCPNVRETSMNASVNTCQMSEEPRDVQKKTSSFPKMSTILEGSQNGSYLKPSTSCTVPAPVISTTDQHNLNLDEEIISCTVQNCALTNYPPVEKQSAASIQLTDVTSKDTSDPHSQMTKTQFLAQLAVSPIVQDPEKDSANSSTETSLVARLRSHLKTHLQIRRAKAEPCVETETNTVSPKKLRLDNEGPNDDITSEPIPVSPKNATVVEDMTSLNKTTKDVTPISNLSSGLCKNDVKSKRSVNEPTTSSSKRSQDIGIRISSGTGIGSKTKQPSSVSPRRSSSTKDNTSLKNTNSSSVSPRRTGLTRDGTSPKNTNSSSVSPRRTGLTRDGTSPKNTNSSSVSPRRTGSTKDDSSLKSKKLSCVTPKRASTVKDGASPKNTKSTCVSPRRTCSIGPSPQKTKCASVSRRISTSTSESMFDTHRRSSFTKTNPGIKQVKRESNSFSPRRFSVTTDGALTRKAKSETVSSTATWLCKDDVSRKRTVESTSAKKPRLSQNGTSSTKNLRVVKKLTKAAKSKTIAKMQMSKQKLQNGAKTSQLVGNQANCESVKKFTSKAIWIPPRMPITKTPKKETKSPDHTAVYPPSLTVHPIPVKAPPVVSPLQPLLVIGGHLLKNQCGECGRVLSSSAALESHVGLHTGRRPFSCTLCGKSFPDSKGLKRHGRVHRNGRIHVCPQCGKGFVYRFGLTKHLQMVHGRLKPFVCQICNKGFYTKRDVESHIRIHTGEKPFHCNLCEKKFTRRVELNVHLRWHNGEKRHWCPYCGKGFLDFNNMKRHKYIHTGEKPHSCPHCPKRFTQSGHLKKHIKNVHKLE